MEDLITIQSFSFILHFSFFVLTLVQSLLHDLFMPKPAWFGCLLFVCLYDILLCVSYYYNTSHIVEVKTKEREKDYAIYTWSSFFQTLLCLVIITPVSFVDLAVYSPSMTLIISDANRYKEYLSLFPILILPILFIWPITVIIYSSGRRKINK